MRVELIKKLTDSKKGYFDKNGIYITDFKDCVKGTNEKYMKMYNWMSYGMNFMEKVVGFFAYGKSIAEARKSILSRIEWKDNLSVLYVSIGNGMSLPYIPKNINVKTLDFVGLDISIGMLKQANKKYNKAFNLSLVNACAENLPFKDDIFDIVFHIGGINFFNNKELAISEMIRVAKKGTRILIADETSEVLEEQYKKNVFIKKYFDNTEIEIDKIVKSVPENVEDFQFEYMWDKRFYCLTFRK